MEAMKTLLWMAALAMAAPVLAVAQSGKGEPQPADPTRMERPAPAVKPAWNEGFIPEDRRDPEEMERGASSGSSSIYRGGTDLGREAEREEEEVRRRARERAGLPPQSQPKPLNLR